MSCCKRLAKPLNSKGRLASGAYKTSRSKPGANMTDIVTLTLNPALDLSTSVERLIPGHKLRCGDPRRDPGGGGVNVARVITRLGGAVTAIYPAGGPSGAMLQRLLRHEGVTSHVVLTRQDTRENFHVFEEATKQQYRFTLPGPLLSRSAWRRCHSAVLSGIAATEIYRLQRQFAARCACRRLCPLGQSREANRGSACHRRLGACASRRAEGRRLFGQAKLE